MEILTTPRLPELDGEVLERLRQVGAHVLARHPLPSSVQLVLVDDEYMRELNSTYRGKPTTTDVLSFDLDLPAGTPAPFEVADGLEKTGGEIYISLRQAVRQADEMDVPLELELARLLIHGLLHLAGYDHDSEEELLHMERETDSLLKSAGLLPVST